MCIYGFMDIWMLLLYNNDNKKKNCPQINAIPTLNVIISLFFMKKELFLSKQDHQQSIRAITNIFMATESDISRCCCQAFIMKANSKVSLIWLLLFFLNMIDRWMNDVNVCHVTIIIRIRIRRENIINAVCMIMNNEKLKSKLFIAHFFSAQIF